VQPRFDSAWRLRALEGDTEAVRQLATAMLPPLYHFCLYRVGKDVHRCEEVVQETLARALEQLEQYDPARCNDNIFPWLTGLARNEINRVLNRERRNVSLDELWQRMDSALLAEFERLEAGPLGDDVLVREETRELVNVAMAQLPPSYRAALEAKYVHGASVRDIADRTRTTEKAVESLLSRARQAFRASFTTLCRALRTEMP
jgi:RNA polymerase sigma-70 factor (ECF subfamily)